MLVVHVNIPGTYAGVDANGNVWVGPSAPPNSKAGPLVYVNVPGAYAGLGSDGSVWIGQNATPTGPTGPTGAPTGSTGSTGTPANNPNPGGLVPINTEYDYNLLRVQSGAFGPSNIWQVHFRTSPAANPNVAAKISAYEFGGQSCIRKAWISNSPGGPAIANPLAILAPSKYPGWTYQAGPVPPANQWYVLGLTPGVDYWINIFNCNADGSITPTPQSGAMALEISVPH